VFAGNGVYELASPITAGDTFVVLNHQYKLRIDYDGDVYESDARVNRNTRFDTLNFIPQRAQGDVRAGFLLQFIANDPLGGEKDYYWFRTKRNGVYLSSNYNVSANAGGGDGSTTDGIDFIPPISIFGNIPNNDTYQVGETVRVEAWSINKTVYDFWEGVSTETNNGGLFATVPENVVTNIRKTKSATEYTPVGCFSISKVDVIEGIVPITTAR
jgi:hypothetical protein